jgi:hypothetical protein
MAQQSKEKKTVVPYLWSGSHLLFNHVTVKAALMTSFSHHIPNMKEKLSATKIRLH